MALPEWVGYVGALLGGGGLTGGGIAALKFKSEKRKLEADAAQVLTASSVDYAVKVSERLDKLADKVDRMEDEQDRQRELLQVHHEWDLEVVSTVRGLGGTVPNPPPLFLASKAS
ncbi:hypothetical protein [Lentzea aerocolonigenes]|uniref:hypothetical protein n=1 Tax=Lentzea aerocolonigenes TaxID=68170 RepID=UPI000A8D4C6C|nr:hypothetical protein [Lentzea aerocolonigenes]MCP2243201.1 hypothetical protein [Lentzea aerocolonigenes]